MSSHKSLRLFLNVVGSMAAALLMLVLIFYGAGQAREALPTPEENASALLLETIGDNDELVGWTNAGLYGATIDSMAFDPLRDHLYLDVSGATYRSTDNGQTWTQITQNGDRGVAVDPVNGTVYIGAWGDGYPQIWVSQDGGLNWTAHNLDSSAYSIALDPQDGQALFAGTNGTMNPLGGVVYRTLDGGDTWYSTPVDLGYCISSVAVDPTDSNRVWAVSGSCDNYPNHSTVYTSFDRGVTFSPVFTSSNGFEYSQLGFDKHGNLFLMGDGMRVSQDGGVTFSAEDFDESIPYSSNKSLVFDATTGWTYFDAYGTHVSKDGGISWENTGLPRLVGINPESSLNMFSMMRPGLSRSLDGGNSWQGANTGLEHVIVPHLDGPAAEPVVYATTHQGFGRSLDGGLTWDFPVGIGNGTYGLGIDPADPSVVYIESGPSAFSVSQDYGETWNTVVVTPTNAQVTSFAVSHFSQDIIYVGLSTLRGDPSASPNDSGLYASLDGGSTWDLVGLEDKQVYVIKSAEYLTGTLIYAGLNYDDGSIVNTGLYRGLAGGSAWELVGLGDSVINDLAVDPSNPQHLLAAVGHWHPTLQPMGLYESYDAGDSWMKVIFNPESDLAAWAVTFDRNDPGIVYVAAGTYLFRTLDNGLTWTRYEQTSNRNFQTLYIPPGEQVRLYGGTWEGAYYRPVGAIGMFDPLLGGTLFYTDTLGYQAELDDDGGSVDEQTKLYYLDLPTASVASQPRSTAIRAFQLNAFQADLPVNDFSFQQPMMLTLTSPDFSNLGETIIHLLYWTGTAWAEAACGDIQIIPEENQLVVPVCQSGQLGLFMENEVIFLPMVERY